MNLHAFLENRTTGGFDFLGLWTVSNNGPCPVIAKPEDGGFGVPPPNGPIVIMPGETTDLAIDGVISCCPQNPDCVYMKVVDGGRVEVGADGRLTPLPPEEYMTPTPPSYPPFFPPKDAWYCLQGLRGGCKPHKFTTDGAWGTEELINKMCDDAKKKMKSAQTQKHIPQAIRATLPNSDAISFVNQTNI